jgi:leucyl-tRNA synthetase
MSYPHHEIDGRWQVAWDQKKAFVAGPIGSGPKFYALDMFPYPSGAGLHVGHLASYTPTDIVARYKRAKGFNVLHPMGYDAFGLPAEQYAIQTGVHPEVTTKKAIENFRRQLKSFGFSFDWEREVSTCDKEFYHWTQFIFLKLFEKGLAYQKEAPVNWCPALRTVLANEEVVDGKSERGGHPVIRVKMKQWMLKITAYAERLLNDLETLDWPQATKDGQRNWIGRSEGAVADFSLAGGGWTIKIYTTRPDTMFGATFMVLAPEHPFVKSITSDAQRPAVEAYVEQASRKSEVDRKAATEKTGVFTGAYARNPANGQSIPIWISDYVLMDYGTGAIMAVPGHDERDFEFATKFDLPIVRVVNSTEPLPFTGEGPIVNSKFLDGMSSTEAIQAMFQFLEKEGLGRREVQYKLRDWLFSRQRYWGEPIPILYSDKGTGGKEPEALPLDELPLTLPEVADYQPTEKGEPPLARVSSFVNHKSGKTRDTDTMPGSAGSSWYFLRYTDPHNRTAPFSALAQKYWMPVDLYVGGAEHTVGHLLYARFWHKVLFDAGLVSHPEPFQKLAHQGVVLGPDGQRMSKSRGNVINPDEVREQYGADAVRLYICFMGPFDKDKPWDTKGIEGVRRFLDRIWRLVKDEDGNLVATKTQSPPEVQKLLHKTLKKVGEDIESLSFNTAISAMMILVNEIYRHEDRSQDTLKVLAQMLMPFAPHFAEEVWWALGGQSHAEQNLVSKAPWPAYNPELIVDDEKEIGVQVNGKVRGSVRLLLTATEDEAVTAAKSVNSIANAIGSMAIIKVIYKPGRILNFIVK